MNDNHLQQTAEALFNWMSGQTEQQMKFDDKLRIMRTGKSTYMKYADKCSLPFSTAKNITKGKQYLWWNFLLRDVLNAKNISEFQERL